MKDRGEMEMAVGEKGEWTRGRAKGERREGKGER